MSRKIWDWECHVILFLRGGLRFLKSLCVDSGEDLMRKRTSLYYHVYLVEWIERELLRNEVSIKMYTVKNVKGGSVTGEIMF